MGTCLWQNRDLAGAPSDTNQLQAPHKTGSRAGSPCKGPALNVALSARSQGLSKGIFSNGSSAKPPKNWFLRKRRYLAKASSETTQSQSPMVGPGLQSQTPQENWRRAALPCEGPVLNGALSATNQGLSVGPFSGNSTVDPPRKLAPRGPPLQEPCA